MNVDKRLLTPRFSTIRVDSSVDGDVHWMFMHNDAASGARPCFRGDLLDDMWSFTDAITLSGGSPLARGQLRHFVLASDASVFNLGGDLELFTQLIRLRDKNGLLAYARRCVEGVHTLHAGLGGDVRTIALLQGDALGGGLEMALACHTIVAEEGVGLGLPEVLFGLFPGMGAYSFLCQRVSPQLAERIILEGTVYSSEQMHALGVVDVLVPKGHGKAAVQELIRNQRRSKLSHLAMNAVRRTSRQVPLHELMAITEIWVDTALALDDKSLRMMDRLVRAQSRRAQSVAALA
ncbi:crotonase/enoyl-CoA hydratase family protein [Xanthomonas theicola]|uniref:Enoyl-CoA hydratase n=1 Tax=Xanthomonas theicola TaxID=56464 RepID=A0A2S6ZJ10_9XANT|nr:crotonase/enoyl-CoA hydratase family protein [Xanthomonas theicola]PPT92130.1 enoyl-CoA hydratase [Xanthomonas theicola]QNH24206.1 crotonase/enoyl-CoA hydratase family protein [Xanthomonas theicola]